MKTHEQTIFALTKHVRCFIMLLPVEGGMFEVIQQVS